MRLLGYVVFRLFLRLNLVPRVWNSFSIEVYCLGRRNPESALSLGMLLLPVEYLLFHLFSI